MVDMATFRSDKIVLLLEVMDSSFSVIGVGGLGGTIVANLAHEVKDISETCDIRFFLVDTEKGSLRRSYSMFPKELRHSLYIIPVSLSAREVEAYNQYYKVIDSNKYGLSEEELVKLARLVKVGKYDTLNKILKDYNFKKNELVEVVNAIKSIAKLGKRLKGSGKKFERGLELFRNSYNVISDVLTESGSEMNIVTGSFAGGTGSAGIPFIAKILSENLKDTLIIISGFKARKIDGPIKQENYIRSSSEARRYSDLLIEHDIEQFKNSTPKEINNLFTQKHAVTIYFLARILGYIEDDNTITNVDYADFRTALGERGTTIGEMYYIYDRISRPQDIKDIIVKNLNEKVGTLPNRVVLFVDVPEDVRLEDIDEMLKQVIDEGHTDVFQGIRQTQSKDEVWVYYLPLYTSSIEKFAGKEDATVGSEFIVFGKGINFEI